MKERGLTMYRLAILSGVPRSTIATMQLSKTVTLALNSIIHLAGKQSAIAQPTDFPLGKRRLLSTAPNRGKGRILRPFFMSRTSVIYVLVNSLVLAFESIAFLLCYLPRKLV